MSVFTRSRALRAAAALAMAPVVVFGTPTTSAAATPVGGYKAVTISFDDDPLVPGYGDGDCWFTVSQEDTQVTLAIGAGRCIANSTDVSPGWSQKWEAGSDYEISAGGVNAQTGAQCGGATAGVFQPNSANGTQRVAGSIPAGGGDNGIILAGASPGGCNITEVCITARSTWGPDSSSGPHCDEVDLPAAPPSSACPFGTPSTMRSKVTLHTHTDYVDTYRWTIKVDGTDGPSGAFRFPQGPYERSAYRGWHITMLGRYPGGGASNETQRNNAFTFYEAGEYGNPDLRRAIAENRGPLAMGHQHGPVEQDAPSALNLPPIPPTPPTNTIGATSGGWMVYYIDPDNPATSRNGAPHATNITQPNAYTVASTVPTSTGNFGGLTIPSRCVFYIGTKVTNIANTDADEPWTKPTAEPPDVDPDPPTDDPEPQPPEGFDWLQAIWAMLNNIWGAIKSVAGALLSMAETIATAVADALAEVFSTLLDGIAALFIPDEGFMDAKIIELEDDWDATSPAKYVDAITDLNPGSVDGCGGLPLNVDLGSGVQVHENIGAACSGTMATAASVVKVALSIGLVVFGALTCIRAIGSGLGWTPTVGTGRGDL